jgi:hypothetical protein|tara:strand:+ start:1392 stop:1610 length:219 start_codon:yes stop_codon:yes gene_type:complete
MKPGDIVRNKNSESGELGLFVGLRTFKHNAPSNPKAKDYTCAEVMWFSTPPPRGEVASTIQTNLIEVISESG